jgi:hypothetical protein
MGLKEIGLGVIGRLIWLSPGKVAGFAERDNELSISIKCGTLRD